MHLPGKGKQNRFCWQNEGGEEKNKKDQALKVEGESTGNEGHLWGNVETQHSRNSLESISMVLVKTPRNGEYRA